MRRPRHGTMRGKCGPMAAVASEGVTNTCRASTRRRHQDVDPAGGTSRAFPARSHQFHAEVRQVFWVFLGSMHDKLKAPPAPPAPPPRHDALHHSEERFRLLVEGVKDYAIFMLDPDGHVASWNTGAQRIYGYTADDIV